MAGRLEGKVALITGTGGGQGRAAALLFAKEGARVIGCDLKVEGAKATVEMVKAAGGEMISMQPLDLGDENQVKQWIDFAIKTHGRIDILYNNAGDLKVAPIEQMTEEEWHYTIRNELDLVYLACRYAWPHLKASGNGVIINTSSLVGIVSQPKEVIGHFAHGAAKGAIISLTRHLAVEGAPHGIRVNTISPGIILTPVTAWRFEDPASKEAWLRRVPLYRLGEPEDIANTALFLASDESSYITGANIVVDGGLTAQ